jgi:hypothetical protein
VVLLRPVSELGKDHEGLDARRLTLGAECRTQRGDDLLRIKVLAEVSLALGFGWARARAGARPSSLM